jgi:hypothetical protein
MQARTKNESNRKGLLSMATLHGRARDARVLLRDARRHVASVEGLQLVDAALDETERLVPGVMDRSDDELLAAVRRMRAADRAALRSLLAGGGDLSPALLECVGDVSAREAIDAIDRISIYDKLAVEVMALLHALEQTCDVAC